MVTMGINLTEDNMAYDNTNSGMLARNKRKEKDTHPDFSGSNNADGVDYWMSAWVNEGKPGSKMEGQKYFSIKINRKDSQIGASGPSHVINSDFDDIPF